VSIILGNLEMTGGGWGGYFIKQFTL
jgi:hypothetical protein